MDLRDLGIALSIVTTLISLAYTLGQLKGNYVTREMWRDLENRLAKQAHDSSILHLTLATKSEVDAVQGKIDRRFEALGAELSKISSAIGRTQRAVETISQKLWPQDRPPKIEGDHE